MSTDFTGTPDALLPITEQVLAWVAEQRANPCVRSVDDPSLRWPTLDDLRRIELCALATREACFLHDLYPVPLPRSGRVVHRDPADDSGFYLPET